MAKPTYAFGYYGGKLSHLSRLLPLLPKCQTYVEPFGGSAAVLLNREPSSVDVYNDLDGGVVNFFRVLRERTDELVNALELTPYSRAEFAQACLDDSTDDLERARRFFVRIAQSRANKPLTTGGEWSYSVGRTAARASDWKYCVAHTKRAMAGAVSAWLTNVGGLSGVVARLQTVQLECLDALDCIRRYDHAGALIYADPPYLPDTRGDGACYVHEMSAADHVELAVELRSCEGRVAVSGYENSLYDQLYAGWFKTTWAARATTNHETVTGARTEILWTNYDPTEATEQPMLFSEASQ